MKVCERKYIDHLSANKRLTFFIGKIQGHQPAQANIEMTTYYHVHDQHDNEKMHSLQKVGHNSLHTYKKYSSN